MFDSVAVPENEDFLGVTEELVNTEKSEAQVATGQRKSNCHSLRNPSPRTCCQGRVVT